MPIAIVRYNVDKESNRIPLLPTMSLISRLSRAIVRYAEGQKQLLKWPFLAVLGPFVSSQSGGLLLFLGRVMI